MKNDVADSRLLERLGPALGGVFTLPDLANAFAEPHANVLYRRIRRLEELGLLSRFSRGMYVTPGFSPEVLSQKLAPASYLSCGTILAQTLVIGSRPDFQVDAVKLGRGRTYSDGSLTVRHLGCSKSTYFGFEKRDGIARATPEKAFIDTLYYHQHGTRFHFDIYSDMNLDLLDRKRMGKYLKRYRNPRFRSFVEGICLAST